MNIENWTLIIDHLNKTLSKKTFIKSEKNQIHQKKNKQVLWKHSLSTPISIWKSRILALNLYGILKRTILILFSFIYLATSSGIFLSMHYCSGDLSEIKFYGVAGCECGDEPMSSDCCDDQNTFIKIKDEHNSSKLAFSVNQTLKLLTGTLFHPIELPQSGIKLFYAKNTDGPPITSSSELNILYRVFRI